MNKHTVGRNPLTIWLTFELNSTLKDIIWYTGNTSILCKQESSVKKKTNQMYENIKSLKDI